MKKFVALAMALAMMLGIVACSNSNGNTNNTPNNNGSSNAGETGGEGDFEGTVKVGFLAFLSGADNYLGVQPQLAMEDYLEEVNANGGWLGHKVELVTYDVARGLEEFVPATTKMIEEDGCIAILGPTNSAGAMAAMPVVTDSQVPLIALAATAEYVTVDEDTGDVNDWMFRVCFIDPYQADGLANFCYADQNFTKVAILSDVTNTYSVNMENTFIENFEGLGGEIVAIEHFNENDVDFRAQLTNIANSGCEAIFVPANNIRYGVLIAQQARELGIEVPMVMPDAVYGPELMEAADELEGSFVSTGLIDSDPAYEEYREEYTAKHDLNANIYCYYGLDAIMALEAAINEANSLDPSDIRDALENLTDAPVFTGSLTIDPATHNPLNKPITIMQIHDGNFELYKVFDPAADAAA